MIYDAAIIGTGPAGLSAALNLKIHEKSFILLGSKSLSGKIQKAEQVRNYLGLPDVSGAELAAAFLRHIQSMDIPIVEEMVNSILSMGKHYALMAGSEFYEAKTVLLSTGAASAGTLPGEDALVGNGVSYCATCDGNLYRGKTIAVICGAARFEHEALYLAGLAGKVYYFPLYASPSVERENVEVMSQRAVGIEGEARVSGVRLKNVETLAVDGVFCLRESVALATLLPGLAVENGHIAVDRTMAANLPGIYAAGDCTGRPYQYSKAAGEGNTAAHSMLEYLAELEKAEGK